MTATPQPTQNPYEGWQALIKKYQQPDTKKAVWQVINSYGGLFLGWILMYLSLSVGYWLTLLLALPTAGFVVRIFIIQHDCGHGSFLKSRRVNDTLGMICGAFTFTSYRLWRHQHAVHHAHHAELEERGTGDVWTMTVDEYFAASGWVRMAYRVMRNPFFLFGLAPTANFILLQRWPLGYKKGWPVREWLSVWWTNLAIGLLLAGAILLVGWQAVLMIQLPVLMVASTVGTWLFYVQHQFERTYWEHTPVWDYTLAALEGSSYYQLPKVLQWFTGNIGFHHIHHLSPRIPNYKLPTVHAENPLFQQVVHLTLRSSLATVWLALWDENKHQLVTFRQALQGQKEQNNPI